MEGPTSSWGSRNMMMMRMMKIFKSAPTCFRWQRNRHQGALWSETCCSTFKYFIILIISMNYIFVHLLGNKVFNCHWCTVKTWRQSAVSLLWDIPHLMTITANREVKKRTRNVHNYVRWTYRSTFSQLICL